MAVNQQQQQQQFQLDRKVRSARKKEKENTLNFTFNVIALFLPLGGFMSRHISIRFHMYL